MPRAFHLHGVLFLLLAFLLLFFTALSLPFLPSLDLVRVHFGGVPSTGYGGQASLTELRVSLQLIDVSAHSNRRPLIRVRCVPCLG